MEPEEDKATPGFFPAINQFRSTVKAERDWATYHNDPPRVRTYLGTVKLHGTNAGISMQADGEIIYRSRTRVVSPDDDNCGFAAHMAAHESVVREVLGALPSNGEMISVFGEWCGQGIQRGVGISAEPKMFVVFAARIGSEWIDASSVGRAAEARIFNIRDFPSWQVEIDFDHPEKAQNVLRGITEKVEQECPVAAAFGHIGVGEGVVWMPIDGDRDSRYWFKVKGEKHSATKVKVLAAVDVERFQKRDELVAALVTIERMKQGLDLHVNEFKRPLDMTGIADYLRWVFADITKEDADTIDASGFTPKDLGKGVSDIARRYYIAAVNNFAS